MPVGLPRTYVVCLLFVKRSFRRDRSVAGGAAVRSLLATGKYSAAAPGRSQLPLAVAPAVWGRTGRTRWRPVTEPKILQGSGTGSGADLGYLP